MSASKEHWQAMALVNAGERIRRLKRAGVSEDIIRENQREVWRRGARFLLDLIGRESFFEVLEGEHSMDYAVVCLNALRPLFPFPPSESGVFWTELIGEIGRLSYGDEPEIIKPEPRLPGQPARPAKIALLRLRALEWAAFWKATDARPILYQRAIGLAFGAEWDAIRHWSASIIKVIGQRTLAEHLATAPNGYFIPDRDWHQTLMDPLWIDGTSYRAAIGLPELSGDVVHREWEKLTRSLSVHVGSHPCYSP